MSKALARLRAKTDRELSILAEKQLEQTLTLAKLGRHADAARAFDSARRLLAVTRLSTSQQERLEMQLTQARAVIEMPARAVA